ncbi:Holliday junction resolvase [Candidatus Woesearchaeota archaeon]|nr:Holliday junction resolvase [Candidatus Woesearchaeota archaeon]|tara:strand:+ start:684 stop:1055 length:372 start_codon:yes stop_codon:yes gene_type:complete
MSKTRGTAVERELIHLFWEKGWAACRVAGSGSMRYPSPDILASNGTNLFAIECKSSRKDAIYIPLAEIKELTSFALLFRALPLVGTRFSKKEWRFVKPEMTATTEKFAVFKPDQGVSFDQLTK